MMILGLWTILVGCTQDSDTEALIKPPIVYPSNNNTRAKARHILITYEGAWRSFSRRTKQDALLQLQYYQRQIQLGSDFGDIAQQHSEDPQKKDGGGLGVVVRGEMLPEFETALFQLQINEISTIIETGFGYHLIQRLPLDERQLIHISVKSDEISTYVQTKLNDGEDPRLLAKEYSTGAHGLRGGELGWFERQDLDQPFVEPVFALQLGQCTQAIKRKDEWHFFCRQG